MALHSRPRVIDEQRFSGRREARSFRTGLDLMKLINRQGRSLHANIKYIRRQNLLVELFRMRQNLLVELFLYILDQLVYTLVRVI